MREKLIFQKFMIESPLDYEYAYVSKFRSILGFTLKKTLKAPR